MEDHEMVPIKRKKALRRNFEVRILKSTQRSTDFNDKNNDPNNNSKALIIKMYKKRESSTFGDQNKILEMSFLRKNRGQMNYDRSISD